MVRPKFRKQSLDQVKIWYADQLQDSGMRSILANDRTDSVAGQKFVQEGDGVRRSLA
jgi:hypothetical protein